MSTATNTDERYFAYLVKLRDSSQTNMWGSPAYLARAFSLSPKEAGDIVGRWMDSFDQPKAAK